MSLVNLWKENPDNVKTKHIQQIISFAGSGQLLDGSETSKEFRGFLSYIPSSLLQRYASECVGDKFDDRGLALQDVVNEVGRRLGFIVTAGRYRGVPGQPGNDGLWLFPDKGRAIVIEVKTTDTYKIDLRTLEEYRRRVQADSRIEDEFTSTLIVLGAEETENLEAQIRGSRYAWGIRLISVDALLRILNLKEETDDPIVFRRIQEILVPREFTKLDQIIDLVFSTAKEIRETESANLPEEMESDSDQKTKYVPETFNEDCVSKVEAFLGKTLIKQSRSKFSSSDGAFAVVCAVSREYSSGGSTGYWFAFHKKNQEALAVAKKPYVVFGCGTSDQILLIPLEEFRKWLDGMNVTETENRFYWHVSIFRENGKFVLHRKKGMDRIDLTRYLLQKK
jgi:hypothetical protein